MGSIQQSGYGYGMTKDEAIEDFSKKLRNEYGEGYYNGGYIKEIISIKQTKKPKTAKTLKTVKTTKHIKTSDTINGFKVTNISEIDIILNYSGNGKKNEFVEYCVTLTEAQKVASKLAKEIHENIYIEPCKLKKNGRRLEEVKTIMTISPKGTPAQFGEWYIEAWCAW